MERNRDRKETETGERRRETELGYLKRNTCEEKVTETDRKVVEL
jgi:hypothetical protein